MNETNQDKIQDNKNNLQKNLTIFQLIREKRREKGSWCRLARTIYLEKFEGEDKCKTASEEEKEIKKFSVALSKAVQRGLKGEYQQNKIKIGDEYIYLYEIAKILKSEEALLPATPSIQNTKHSAEDLKHISNLNTCILEQCSVNWIKLGKDIEKYFEDIKSHADNGIKELQTLLAHYYYYCGKNEIRNVDKAYKLYQKAAEQNDELALYALGMIYEYGELNNQISLDRAFKYYKKSADQGFVLAINKVAYCYYKGYGTNKDLQKFFEFSKKSADLQNPQGVLYTAYAYKTGEGTQENIDEAINILEAIDKNPTSTSSGLTFSYEMYTPILLAELYKKKNEIEKSKEVLLRSVEKSTDYMTNLIKENYDIALDLMCNMTVFSIDKQNDILKSSHYDYIHNPPKPTQISTFFSL